MKKQLLLAGLILASHVGIAQSAQDIENIKKLEGCFHVTFNYAETFTNDTSKEYKAKAIENKPVVEYSFALEESPKKIVLQHILVIPGGTMIKHWREDWEYEPTTMWTFDHDGVWKKVALDPKEVKGKWMQSVWEVSDAPRYQGLSQWVYINGAYRWMNTTDAPLPRREYTTREDYNVLERTNMISLTNYGYMHEQDNRKIIRKTGSTDSVLAYEKGYNKYVRLDDAKCGAAASFWTKERAAFWDNVKSIWKEYMDKNNSIKVSFLANHVQMFEALDVVEKQKLSGAAQKAAIKKTMDAYITVTK